MDRLPSVRSLYRGLLISNDLLLLGVTSCFSRQKEKGGGGEEEWSTTGDRVSMLLLSSISRPLVGEPSEGSSSAFFSLHPMSRSSFFLLPLPRRDKEKRGEEQMLLSLLPREPSLPRPFPMARPWNANPLFLFFLSFFIQSRPLLPILLFLSSERRNISTILGTDTCNDNLDNSVILLFFFIYLYILFFKE